MENSAYRIIDANLNRGREAARVMEEFCRFHLNSPVLSGRAKNLRHKLCTAGSQFEITRLMISRESDADVGRGLAVADQLKRTSLQDALIAASKRLSEALRALAEVGAAIEPNVAAVFEKLRFEAYSLEKDAILTADAQAKVDRIRLYVLITATSADRTDKLIDLMEACATGGADCIQLRAKGLPDAEIYDLASRLATICRDSDVVSVINDRPDIALASGADGVHLGQDDLPVAAVRNILTRPLVIGLSTHSPQQLQVAIQQRPDYVGLGPVFATTTKQIDELAGTDYITRAVEMLANTGIGHVAIGGINSDNLSAVLASGAGAVAVCSAVTASFDPAAACKRLKLSLKISPKPRFPT